VVSQIGQLQTGAVAHPSRRQPLLPAVLPGSMNLDITRSGG
jgi:hypothetical protein